MGEVLFGHKVVSVNVGNFGVFLMGNEVVIKKI